MVAMHFVTASIFSFKIHRLLIQLHSITPILISYHTIEAILNSSTNYLLQFDFANSFRIPKSYFSYFNFTGS